MPDLNIDVKVGGAQAGAAAVGSVATATEKAGTAAKNFGNEGGKAANALKEFTKSSGDVGQIASNLETASQGGVRGLVGLASGMRGVINLVRGAVAATGPFGLLVTVLGTLGGLFLTFGDKIAPAKKGIDEVGDSLDDARKSAEALDKLTLQKFNAQVATIGDTAADAKKKLDLLKGAQEEISGKVTEAQVEKVQKDGTLSDEQKKTQIDAINKDAAQQKQAREFQALRDELAIEQDKADALNKAAESPRQRVVEAVANQKALEEQKAERVRLDAELREEQKKLIGRGQAYFVKNAPEAARRRNAVPEVSDSQLQEAGENIQTTIKTANEAEEKYTVQLKVVRDKRLELETKSLVSQSKAAVEAAKDPVAAGKKALKATEDVIFNNAPAREPVRKNSGGEIEFDGRKIRVGEPEQSKTPTINGEPIKQLSRENTINGQPLNPLSRENKIERTGGSAGVESELKQGFQSAAQGVQDAPEFDPQPVVDAAQAITAAVVQSATQSASAVATAAGAIGGMVASIPVALDPSPIVAGLGAYHQTNLARHQETQAAMKVIQDQVRIMAMQIAGMRG